MNNQHAAYVNTNKSETKIENQLKNCCFVLGCTSHELSSNIRPDDFINLTFASKWAMQVREVLGMTQVITIELMTSFLDQNHEAGKTVMVKTFTYTPNNHGTSAVGEIIFNKSFDSVEEASACFDELYGKMVETL